MADNTEKFNLNFRAVAGVSCLSGKMKLTVTAQ